jgi:hypothetical protein
MTCLEVLQGIMAPSSLSVHARSQLEIHVLPCVANSVAIKPGAKFKMAASVKEVDVVKH